jgi:mannosyl-3-phosphoglycerate phosphatase
VQMIIFTDLDGSLLNYENYSFTEASQSLERIIQSGIPLIMATSKTRREVELLQMEMGIREPFIVENGGGIFFPRSYRNLAIENIENQEQRDEYTVIATGASYSSVRDFLEKVSTRFSIRGFGDMTPAEIAWLSSLPIERATLAKEREFTEPFIIERPEEIGPLSDMAEEEGLRVTRGGRFYHLMGKEQDKGKAVRIVLDIFRRNSVTELTAIGLGDSENDLAMLSQVDIPVLIPRQGKGYLDIRMPGLIRAREEGTKGWNEVIQRLLDERMDIIADHHKNAGGKS